LAARALTVGDGLQGWKSVAQFVVFQEVMPAELSTGTILPVLQVGFENQNPAGRQTFLNGGKEAPHQKPGIDDQLVAKGLNPKGVHILADAVDRGRTADETPQAFFGNIHRIDVKSASGKKTGIAPVAAGQIQGTADRGMMVKGLHDP
jgi:hypothetical protein